MKDYSYHFNCMQIPYGDGFIEVNGTAKYQIEDLSSGEDDSSLIAFFYEAKIRNYDTETDEPLTGLTKKDLEALSDVVLEKLNDNYELCTELAINPKE